MFTRIGGEKMKDNNMKVIGGVVGLFAIVALISVVWASFTERLEIDGTGTVKLSSWEIAFTSVSEADLTGTAKEITKPELTSTKIGDFAVQLTTPGDSVTYEIEVENKGTYDAEISSITIPTPACEGSGTNAETDAANVCKNLTYTLTYEDGKTVKQTDTLASQEKKKMILKLAYSSAVTATELPTNDVTISNLTIPIIYAQS